MVRIFCIFSSFLKLFRFEIYFICFEFYRKHPNTTGAIPLGRRSHSAFVYHNLLYIFGGYNGITDQHFNDLYCFDPDKNRWCLVATRGAVPKPRRRQVCLVIDKRLYLFGGTRLA